MRGEDCLNGQLFSYIDMESRIHEKHPLRLIREVVNGALAGMSAEFDALYADDGRPPIAPEKLLRALLLQAFYGLRSERQLVEQLEYNTLYKWFVGLNPDAPVWDASMFCKNRDRLLEAEISQKLLAAIMRHPREKADEQGAFPGGRHTDLGLCLDEIVPAPGSFMRPTER